MNILQQLRKENVRLKSENAELKQAQEATQKDIIKVVHEVKQLWSLLELDFNDLNVGNYNTFKMVSLATTVGKKFFTGNGKEQLIQSWGNVSPILSKYQHLIEDEK